jgi:hypothetical protein
MIILDTNVLSELMRPMPAGPSLRVGRETEDTCRSPGPGDRQSRDTARTHKALWCRAKPENRHARQDILTL